MKTGIVLEIKNDKAIIMRPGGSFVMVPTQPCWRKGDTVSLRPVGSRHRPFLVFAACLLLFLGIITFGGYQLYTAPVATISIDVNPSIELQVNQFGRILSSQPFNPDATNLLAQANLNHTTIDAGLQSLFACGLADYLQQSPYIILCIQSSSDAKAKDLTNTLQKTLSNLQLEYPSAANAQISLYTVDAAFVENAHNHHVTAGKLKTLLELQALDPNISIDAFSHCSIGELHEQMEAYRNRANLAESEQNDTPETIPSENTPIRPRAGCHRHGH